MSAFKVWVEVEADDYSRGEPIELGCFDTEQEADDHVAHLQEDGEVILQRMQRCDDVRTNLRMFLRMSEEGSYVDTGVAVELIQQTLRTLEKWRTL